MSAITTLTTIDGIGILEIDNPPVNAFSGAVRAGVQDKLAEAIADDGIVGLVIACAGRTFVAGADISEFGKPPVGPSFHEVFRAIEASPKPVVAAIHGTALGGGFELALACNARVASQSAKVGLPEVALGILPGAGGTQRVPRLVGAEKALEIIVGGKPLKAGAALVLGLIDAVVPDAELRDAAIAKARELANAGLLPRVRDHTEWTEKDRADTALFETYRKANARRFKGYKAQPAIVDAVEAAVTLPFDEGLRRETELCDMLLASPEAAAQQAYFFAEREAAKVPGLPKDTAVTDIRSAAVIGAGTMGGGIAMALLDGGLSVTLIEAKQDALDRGSAAIRKTVEGLAAKGRISAEAAAERLGRLSPALDMNAAAGADLVIEAVFEDMALKRQIFAALDGIAKPGAILASNTSFLDIDEIAAATSRPEAVIGLHFFSPANIMRLLEIVRGARTDNSTIATAFALARRIGKVGVLSGVCDGFIANRLMLPRARQAEAMALEGTPIETIDRVLTDYGFPMGHFQMMDLAGLDVVARGQTERSAMGDLVAMGRLGQKSGAGYYDYDDRRRATPSSVAAEAIAVVARALGIAQQPTQDDQAILERLLLPVVNEGARILQEGIALRSSDIDVAAILGYGWPVYRGGPMMWGRQFGYGNAMNRLISLAGKYGTAFAPAPLVRQWATDGQ